jgi:uncharacterized membrane protein
MIPILNEVTDAMLLGRFLAHKSNMLLTLMALSYIVTILYVVKTYDSNKTISDILLNQKIKNALWGGMITMGFFTVLYEWERGSYISIGLIGVVLVGIYGILYYDDEKTIEHQIFTTIIVTGIIGFMAYHAIYIDSPLLQFLVCIQLLLMIEIAINMGGHMLNAELGYIVNFGIYYLYLHGSLDVAISTDNLIPI